MTMMANNNDFGEHDDDFGTDGDGVRHCPLCQLFHGPPPCWKRGPEWGANMMDD